MSDLSLDDTPPAPSPGINFFVAGDPVGQPRPRVTINGTFTPHGAIDGWKARIAIGAYKHRPKELLAGPLRVHLVFFFPRPKSHFKGKNKILRTTAPNWHMVRPDRDNLDKAVLDCLTKSGFWGDDCQVCSGYVEKRYCDPGEKPGVDVSIRPITPP